MNEQPHDHDSEKCNDCDMTKALLFKSIKPIGQVYITGGDPVFETTMKINAINAKMIKTFQATYETAWSPLGDYKVKHPVNDQGLYMAHCTKCGTYVEDWDSEPPYDFLCFPCETEGSEDEL